MDLRPRKKPKHQEASSLEASRGYSSPPPFFISRQIFPPLVLTLYHRRTKPTTQLFPSPPSTVSTKRKYRAPSEVTSPTDSTSAADLLPPIKRTRFSPTEDTSEVTTSRYHFRHRGTPPQPVTPRTARHTGMPKSRSSSPWPHADCSRGRDKKVSGEQQSSSAPVKKEKKNPSRSTSASTSKQNKGTLLWTLISPRSEC